MTANAHKPFSKLTNARKSFAELRELYRKRDELWDKLGRSLVIQELWPQAFEHGSVKELRMGQQFSPGETKPQDLELTFENGAGERRTFPLKDVPEPIRSDALRRFMDAYRFPMWKRRRYESYFRENGAN